MIGFYFDRPSAVAAARKAFVINVVGDVGILYAIFVIVAKIGAIGVRRRVRARRQVLAGRTVHQCASGCSSAARRSRRRSRCIPGCPTRWKARRPVSALIHAATMVTAGVYLIARCAPLWNASERRAHAGRLDRRADRAAPARSSGCAQWDIKRILAYSTMSQIGYMIMGVGVGAYDAGILHFFTHAFFKAQLFLGAGIIIHNLANEQDVRLMGGLRKQMPFAFWAMTIGVLSICGIPGFAGFFSKDAVLERDARARSSGHVGGRRAHRRDHRVLHVPHALRHVLRRVSRARRSERARSAASGAGRDRASAHGASRRHEAHHAHHAPAVADERAGRDR